MNIKAIQIRAEAAADHAAIWEVTRLAFHNAAHTCGREHILVGALREAGALTLSLVAVLEERIVGHVAVSPVTVTQHTGEWFGIGPLSVLPECQRQGIGSKLMNSALVQLQVRGARGCVLVGDPQYYCRFGFQSVPSLVVPGVPSEVTLALRFDNSADGGTVTFHPAFLAAMGEPTAAADGEAKGADL